MSEGIETEWGKITKEHIKDIKRAIVSEGEVVEAVNIEGVVDTIAIIR